MGRTYNLPSPTGPVSNLVPESATGNELRPDTTVLCVNRGRTDIVDKFDGIDYRIPPGEFYAPYGAALHFQNRSVIPGTRNPELGSQQSFIGIVGIDDAAICEPLTDEQCEKFGAAIEAIDRSGLTSAADRDIRVIKPGAPQAGRRAGLRPSISTEGQANDAAAQAAEHIFEKPGTTDAGAAAAEAASERPRTADVSSRIRKGR